MLEDDVYEDWLEDPDPSRRWLAQLSKSLVAHTKGVSTPEWDEYFCAIANVVAMRSKDKNHIVGAVVVQGDVIVATGYNGFPRGVREFEGRKDDKKEKLPRTSHAEENAIFNAARTGISLIGARIYVTTFPCTLCARAIVQSGINVVFTYGDYWLRDPLGYEKAEEILEEAKISVFCPTIRRRNAKSRNAGREGDARVESDPPGAPEEDSDP